MTGCVKKFLEPHFFDLRYLCQIIMINSLCFNFWYQMIQTSYLKMDETLFCFENVFSRDWYSISFLFKDGLQVFASWIIPPLLLVISLEVLALSDYLAASMTMLMKILLEPNRFGIGVCSMGPPKKPSVSVSFISAKFLCPFKKVIMNTYWMITILSCILFTAYSNHFCINEYLIFNECWKMNVKFGQIFV